MTEVRQQIKTDMRRLGRLKIVMALKNVEMCVCDLAAFTGSSESAVSHQLRRLKDLALVKSRRDGQIVYYALDDEHVSGLLEVGLEHIRGQWSDDRGRRTENRGRMTDDR